MSGCSLYIRLSREANDSNLSLRGMVDEARDLAHRLGYEVWAEHIDDGISGAVRDRPEFLAWLEDGRRGHVDALVTFHADRLTREGVNVAAMVLDVVEGKDAATGKVTRQPVRLVSVDGLDSNDADSFRWRFVIAAEVARAERERIKARNIATKKRLRKAGRWAGGVVPFGCEVYELDGGKYLRRNDAEAEILHEAADRLLRGDSIRSVVSWLDYGDIKTRFGKPWQRTTLRNTLLCPPVQEHVFHGTGKGRALIQRLEPKKSGIPHAPGGRPNRHLLSGGLAKCGSCDSSLTTAGGRAGAAVRYTCLGKSKGQKCSGGSTITASALDERIEQEFLEHYGHQYALELHVILEGAEALDSAEKADEEAQEALRMDLTEEHFRAAQEARQALDELRSRPVTRQRQIRLSDKTYAEQWAAADVPERTRMLWGALAQPVVVMPGKPLNSPTGRGKVPNVGRAEILWSDEVNPED
jgi:site-specific DNA recombinase